MGRTGAAVAPPRVARPALKAFTTERSLAAALSATGLLYWNLSGRGAATLAGALLGAIVAALAGALTGALATEVLALAPKGALARP